MNTALADLLAPAMCAESHKIADLSGGAHAAQLRARMWGRVELARAQRAIGSGGAGWARAIDEVLDGLADGVWAFDERAEAVVTRWAREVRALVWGVEEFDDAP